MSTTLPDPLLALRASLSPQSPQQPTLLTSPTPTPSDTTTTTSLTTATHLHLPLPVPTTYPLSTPTRFISTAAGNIPIDLRSIYFAWLRRDVAIPEYIAEAQGVNEELGKLGSGGDDGVQAKVRNLVFVERLDLITWLEGAGEDSEYIKPLEGGAGVVGGVSAAAQAQAEDSARVAAGVVGGVSVVGSAGVGVGAGTQLPASTAVGKVGRTIDPRLQEIYNGERKMGDRNSVLRGIRPTDFSHVRKTAEMFLGRNSRSRTATNKPGATTGGAKPPTTGTPTSGAGSIIKQPAPPTGRSTPSSPRAHPIILLSPSASSLLRMSNIRSFLSDGIYVPPDHPTLATSTTDSNLLYILRDLHSIPGGASASSSNKSSTSTKDPNNPQTTRTKQTRFILVDSTADFKPDYWNRVVAVFTTGQTWQFKSYKWSEPPELFKHAMGIYVGWRGEEVPREVRGWGRGVRSFAIDRWDEKAVMAGGAGGGGVGTAGMSGRWRDRGVVEGIWTAIEEGMKARGWGGGK
ncbi:hypothetical protein FQN50_002792 [Emmonsiellopsis sp. PD_5]|nr:hypothetical protein FQN50_002792 [Emmonsiellopsis sp. PD_5]